MIIVIILIVGIFMLTGCGNNNENGNKGKKWPTDVVYVPNIPYDGKGKIVKTEEDTTWGNQYSIYIKGATLESVNEYVDKLYDNGWKVLNMFSHEGKYLKQPQKDNFFKMGYKNEDESINVAIILHHGNDEYDLVLTFADMNS